MLCGCIRNEKKKFFLCNIMMFANICLILHYETRKNPTYL